MTTFTAGEPQWRARLGTLRQVVRQELVTRQLAEHVPDGPGLRIVDVGCGQGSQLLRLARAGHHVTGVDTSGTMLGDLDAALALEDAPVRARVRLVEGEASAVTGPFDVALCHGVLMYLPDPEPLVATLAGLLRPGGRLSLLVRNADALALRPGLQGRWDEAVRAFDDTAYGNRIGVRARAYRLADLTALLARHTLRVTARYGVRVFCDVADDDAPLPAEAELDALLGCEERAGRTEPYRSVAALTHLVASKDVAG